MSKASTKKAIDKYLNKHNPSKKKRKNKSPEKDFEKKVCDWLKQNNFSYFVAEAKSTYSPKAQRYIAQSITPGASDIMAVDSLGHACFIELKAPGKRSTIRPNQHDFLSDKINFNAFAVCTDSIEHLSGKYFEWIQIKINQSFEEARQFLLNDLPNQKGISSLESNEGSDDSPLFDD